MLKTIETFFHTSTVQKSRSKGSELIRNRRVCCELETSLGSDPSLVSIAVVRNHDPKQYGQERLTHPETSSFPLRETNGGKN